jgi:hypothetical protein
MRLSILFAVTALVVLTLVAAFPQVVGPGLQSQSSADNTREHLAFARELERNSTELANLKAEYNELRLLPERMARIEERLDLLNRMVYAVLGGILALLLKEMWLAFRSLNRSRNGGQPKEVT